MKLLAPGLLEGRAIAVAGPVPETVTRSLEELGARIEPMGALDLGEGAVGDWARARTPLHALVYDGGTSFADGGLMRTMEEAWSAVREAAIGALIEGAHPGKIVLLGPRPDSAAGASAACAALENLARTLSVEWARHSVTAVLVSPGGHGEAELAELVCFLCSRAGDYFSGCRIELGQ